MSNPGDFIIENGVLKKYTGSDADVAIPEGVEVLGKESFNGCSRIRTVSVPDGLKEIEGASGFSLGGAFYGCAGLERITLPDSVETVGNSAFYGCSNLKEVTMPLSAVSDKMFGGSGKTVILTLTDPAQGTVRVVAVFRKDYWTQTWNYSKEYLLPISEDAVYVYDRLLAAGAYDGFGINEDGRIRGALWRLADRRFPMDDEIRSAIADFLSTKLSKALKMADQDRAPAYIGTLLEIGAIHEGDLKKVNRALSKSEVPEIRAMADHLTLPMPSPAEENASPAVETRFVERAKQINAVGILMRIGVDTLPDVQLADGSGPAPADYLRLVLAEYSELVKYGYCAPVPLADEAAAKLQTESLRKALREVFDTCSNEKKQLSLLLPLFRYADGDTVRELYPKFRSVKWKEEAANRALLLSDTREAMLYADKHRLLDQYAGIRGTDADTLRDTALSDFGLDLNGQKRYDLGCGVITVSLAEDLSPTLFDEGAGKSIKSIPKKGADPEKYEAARTDFAELKKNIKKVVKGRGERLFQAFLNGEAFRAESWKASYTGNPVLNMAARLLVWEQNRKTFTLSAAGAVDRGGQPYTITDAPIKVAHPMEMDTADVQAWQKYFTGHGLKQPFAQVWEPVIDPKTVSETRYAGCRIPYYRFLNQEKHGITVTDYDFHNEIQISFAGCSVDVERLDWRRHEILAEDCFEVTAFRFETYSRQVNHIAAYLDRITVWDRVKKDDVGVMEIMDRFTLAQITEFIAAAQEANAVNVLALLLEYKNAHFADFDPMDEFTLEW